MVIYVDTAEQLPFDFASVKKPIVPFRTEPLRLVTGDYGTTRGGTPWPGRTGDASIAATIERKSLADLYKTVAHGRERFERELSRMCSFGYRAVVVEAELSQVMNPNEFLDYPTDMNPKSLLASLIAWQQRFGVHLWFAPGREFAERLTHRLLERWIRDAN